MMLYEQPLNELMRVCLRLECLFHRFECCRLSPDFEGKLHSLMAILIDLLNLLDRPDLKSKWLKELHRYSQCFSKLENAKNISKPLLEETRQALHQLQHHFLSTSGKIGQELRENEFLTAVKQNLGSPGCLFSLPLYQYWLNQSEAITWKKLDAWFAELKKAKAVVDLLLKIARGSEKTRQLSAIQGFYHESLDPLLPYQLVQITSAADTRFFPEVSVGRYRISIRWLTANIDGHPIQTPETVSFSLSYCII